MNANGKPKKARVKMMNPKLPPPLLTHILHDRKQPLMQPTPEFQSNAVLLREETGDLPIYGKWAKPLEHQREAEMELVKERDNTTSSSVEVEDIDEFEFSNNLHDTMMQYKSLVQVIFIPVDKRPREPTGNLPVVTKKKPCMDKDSGLAVKVTTAKGKAKNPVEDPGLMQKHFFMH
ncbi:uncharacterized protein ARMOST_03218 [Armillaria ostoyae]|uniref:Uncharacterized protein n=1 Tax=Armillaria ostoyae TaxID=47428 RepID=A0A284QTY0_ARMOS|nr:uncharacterized protein ARMOST_03218 [Armillaria ostoyae]